MGLRFKFSWPQTPTPINPGNPLSSLINPATQTPRTKLKSDGCPRRNDLRTLRESRATLTLNHYSVHDFSYIGRVFVSGVQAGCKCGASNSCILLLHRIMDYSPLAAKVGRPATNQAGITARNLEIQPQILSPAAFPPKPTYDQPLPRS